MTSSSELSAGELTEALLRGASGLSSSEAAIRLLVEHGVWPARLAAAEFITLSDEDDPDEPRYAWVGWTDVVAALDAGPLTGGSGSENRVRRVAASLSDAVTGLDRDNLALVLAAIFHANGSHQHKDDAAERAAGGVPRVIRPGTPMVELGPVVGSPAVVVATGAHQ